MSFAFVIIHQGQERKEINLCLAAFIDPPLWSFGLIVPVHKKDDLSKVENYRGITLLSSLSKLFTSILNNRLYDYATKKGILKDEQGGFRKYSIVDSIFILKMLIAKYVIETTKTTKFAILLFRRL